MNKIGIYKITNKINGKCYIGQSVNIYKRWDRHKSERFENKLPLYKAFRKYGIENFKFCIIELCDKKELTERELYYYNLLKPEYNILIPGENPMDNVFSKCEYNKKYKNNEASENRSKNLKKRWEDEDYRKKMIFVNSKPSSEEKKRKISESRKNKKPIIMYDLYSLEEIKEFESISEAKKWLRENGCPKADCTPISNVCKGVWKKAYNYFWRFKETQTTIRKE